MEMLSFIIKVVDNAVHYEVEYYSLSALCFLFSGSIAQLGEHLPYKQGVTGSSPVVPTKYAAGVMVTVTHSKAVYQAHQFMQGTMPKNSISQGRAKHKTVKRPSLSFYGKGDAPERSAFADIFTANAISGCCVDAGPGSSVG